MSMGKASENYLTIEKYWDNWASGTLFPKQLTQISSFLSNFLTSVNWLYVGQRTVSVDI